MLGNNPFSILSETISPFAMQSFIIAMVLLIAVGTIIQMIHHKNLTYFFNNAKKAKLSATKKLGVGEKVSVIAKTTVVDIGTTSELGFGKISAKFRQNIARFRLYRRRSFQGNTRFAAFFKIYQNI